MPYLSELPAQAKTDLEAIQFLSSTGAVASYIVAPFSKRIFAPSAVAESLKARGWFVTGKGLVGWMKGLYSVSLASVEVIEAKTK